MNAWKDKIENQYLPDALELGIDIARLVRDVYGPARMTEYLIMTECRLARRLESLHGRIDLDRTAARQARNNVGLFLYSDGPSRQDLTPAGPALQEITPAVPSAQYLTPATPPPQELTPAAPSA